MNSISIAAIHATILTILIGFVSAYGIFKRTTIENAKIEVLEQAEEINIVNFATAIYFPKNQLEDLKLGEEIARYADDIRVYLGMPKPGSRLEIDESGKLIFPSEKARPEEQAQEAEKALALMNIIFHQYPFPIVYRKLKDKRGWDVESPKENIHFRDIDDVKKWLSDIRQITSAFSWVFRFLPLSRYNSVNLLALNEVQKKRIQSLANLPISIDVGVANTPLSIVRNYVTGYRFVENVIKKTKDKMTRLSKLKRGFPKYTILLAITAIFLTFVSGVLLPMIRPNLGSIFLIWVPFVFYFSAFGFIFLKILRT